MYTYQKKTEEEILKKRYEQVLNSNIKLVDEIAIIKKENRCLKEIIKEINEVMRSRKYKFKKECGCYRIKEIIEDSVENNEL